MRFTPSLLLLLGAAYVNGLPSGTSLVERQNSDSEVIASYATQGLCFSYIKGDNSQKSLSPCYTWCKKTAPGVQGVTCAGSASAPGEPTYTDSDGNKWQPGKCQCGGAVAELAEDIFNIVAQGLHQLDHILCAVMLQAFTDIVKAGVNFIPGAGEVDAVKAAVQAAKSMLENTLGSTGFDSWISNACGVQQTQTNQAAYGTLTKMPDSLGTSIGCKQKDTSKCQKVPPVPGKSKRV